jgi:zinc protease
MKLMTTPIPQTHSQSFLTRNVDKRKLSNGLTVITKEMHDKPVVASIIWYRVGSRNEELGQTGKSHFLEHMLFKGTDRFGKGEIDLLTLQNGGANNAFTWLDFTAYYFTFASDRWEVALEIEANRMRNTSFAQEEFDSEKQVVEEELRIGLDGPWEVLENEVWATAFRQHPYHWPTVGWLDDLEATTAEDMKAYYDKWYHPQNATLVLVGDFHTEELLPKVESLFGAIPAGPLAKPLHIVEPPQKGEKRVVVKKETPVERLIIGYHAPAVGENDAYACHLLEAILSTGKTSRLYKRLVEQEQSVTSASAHYNDHIDASLFYFQAEVKPGFTLEAVERAIYEEVDRIKKEAVPEAEIEKAKRQVEADLVLSNEEPLQQAILLGQYETVAFAERIPEESRGYNYLNTLLDRFRQVTAEDVARVAQTYFKQDNRTVGYLINDSATETPPPVTPGAGSAQGGGVTDEQ